MPGLTTHEGVSPTFVAPAIYRQNTSPDYPQLGDLWQDTSVDPVVLKSYTLSGWVAIGTGAAGKDKLDGTPGIDGIDGEDALMIPGAPGPQGTPGATGATGPLVYLAPDEPEDVFPIPGAVGAQGSAGAAGSAGVAGATGVTLYLEPELPDDPMMIPGATGARGATGDTGPQGIAGLTIPPEEMYVEEVGMIPPGTPFPQVHLGAYAPGSFEIPTGFYIVMSQQLQLTSNQYTQLNGTAVLRIT
tara:strand:- start:13567 stop:14298 length:732 start_codon:yes stop_codon:yes gene_type:complete